MLENNTVKTTNIQGLFLVERETFEDGRGFFRETFRAGELNSALGFEFAIKQENHSRSVKNTLRGIHVAPWNKFIYVVRGEVQSVVVDLRDGSATFGEYVSIILGESNHTRIFVPKGCGNSYLVLSEEADCMYLTDDYWSPGKEYGVLWNDSDIKINWQTDKPLLSDKDRINKTIKELFPGRLK